MVKISRFFPKYFCSFYLINSFSLGGVSNFEYVLSRLMFRIARQGELVIRAETQKRVTNA